MFKRLVTAITLCLVLATGIPAASAHASGSDDGSSERRTNMSSNIWQGLCVGASLDLSKASQVRCAAKQRELQREDNTFVDNKPNIGAGLCVGASLDLSKASQRSCVAKTPPPPDTPELLAEGDNTTKHPSATGHTHHRHPSKPKKTQAPPAPTAAPVQYAALGDSIAAGLGVPDPTDSDGHCGRSSGSYVNEVANFRGLAVSNFACEGAKMGDLISKQSVRGPNLPPQLDGAFAGGTPELITITAGANDVRWQDFLRKCYAATCGTSRDTRVASSLIATLGVKTQLVLQDIQQRSSGSPPEVILTGYYLPLSEACAQVEPRLTLEEISWINDQTTQLNQTLENAASQSGLATFVPIDFTGHDICSSDPWVQMLDDPAPFHPTLEGQHAIARAVIN